MLKQRLLTALLLATLFVPALFFLPSSLLALLLGVVVGLTALEWGALAGLRGWAKKGFAAFLVMGGGVILQFKTWHEPILMLGALLWLLLTLRLVFAAHMPSLVHQRGFKLLLAPLILWPAWVALTSLHASPNGPWWVLATLMVVWVADSAAYFAGRRFGRHKLAPSISPGKTIEGLLGALLAVLGLGVLAHQAAPYITLSLGQWLFLLLLVTLISVVGDLHESQLKREAGVKDSGTLLPGHGGMFDRIDSLLAAAPVMAVGLMWLGVWDG